MFKRVLVLVSLCFFVFLQVQDSSAVLTYVGIQIVNLTDDSSNSCVGTVGYPSTGRIRALSSIIPSYPLYVNLTRISDGVTIWSGDIAKNCSSYDDGCDYVIGDVIYIPDSVDLSSGTNYNFFMDIDAIRIYLPLVNYQSFTVTGDNNYWTVGGNYNSAKCEYGYMSGISVCDGTVGNACIADTDNNLVIGNIRSAVLIPGACFSDLSVNNCPTTTYISIQNTGTQNFKIAQQYNNLYQPNVGNVNLPFQFP